MATNAPQEDWHKTGLRLPKDLHARLHEAAARSGRSYNAELVARLESSFQLVPDGMLLPSDLLTRVAELEQDMARLKLAAMIDQK